MAGLSTGEYSNSFQLSLIHGCIALHARTRTHTPTPPTRCDPVVIQLGVCCTCMYPGTIPPYYRELFDVLCPGKENKIEHLVWKACMKSATLTDTVLQQVYMFCKAQLTQTLCVHFQYSCILSCLVKRFRKSA